MTENLFWLGILGAILALLFAFAQSRKVLAYSEGSDTMQKIASAIRKGANAYLRHQYATVFKVFAVVFVILLVLCKFGLLDNWFIPFAFLTGGIYSAISGFVGMRIATSSNARTAQAASESLNKGLNVAFSSGAVMGFTVVGLGLFDISVWFHILKYIAHYDAAHIAQTMVMFGMGASFMALFARVGGGIFTKAADVGADLVGKVEAGIPEDDPRNPAVIADNVGDNVGDVAGMGADLFDSNVAALAAAMVIAIPLGQIELLFCYSALGLLASIVGVLCAKVGKSGNPSAALNRGTDLTCGVFAVLTLFASLLFHFELRLWGATMIGLVVGVIIGLTSDYFTGDGKKPVKNVAEACKSGPAFTILSGMSYGLLSSMPALIGIGLAALCSYKLCEPLGGDYAVFGISVAAIGMLSIVGMIVSNDAYGPIVDNARGVAEMGGLGDEVLAITDELDSAGNTVKAITKGFAIGAAGLTVIALLAAFCEIVEGITGAAVTLNLMDPLVFFGALVGAVIPAAFSAMLIRGVDRNSQLMVREIHNQFNTIPGLREGKDGVLPDYNRCIDIATLGALKELIPAGLMAILATLLTGFIGGVQAVGGFLMGNILCGLLIAMMMSNAGGLWDNAKKYIEAGHCGGKGSDAHKAAVIGDTVGDPFKDTAGPSINTQVTVVSLVSSLAAVLFVACSLF